MQVARRAPANAATNNAAEGGEGMPGAHEGNQLRTSAPLSRQITPLRTALTVHHGNNLIFYRQHEAVDRRHIYMNASSSTLCSKRPGRSRTNSAARALVRPDTADWVTLSLHPNAHRHNMHDPAPTADAGNCADQI